MPQEIDHEIKELCGQIVGETNSNKFLDLVTRLNTLLEQREYKLKHSSAAD
jgi:hypothetical protein